MRFPMAVPAMLLLAALAGSAARAAPSPEELPRRVRIAQFEQYLAARGHPKDAKFAAQLAGFELMERASNARLAHWLQQFSGPKTRAALTALADLSVFKELPAADLPSAPAPDLQTQRLIFARTVDYVVQTRPRLPDFSALRSTTRFEIAPPGAVVAEERAIRMFSLGREKSKYQALGRASPGRDGGQWLFLAATSSQLVTYRDGREVSAASAGDDSRETNAHLSTTGEFGPILTVVVGDATHGKVAWSHWEPGIGKPLAVFLFSVPEEASHYEIADSSAGVSGTFPAYQGEIAVDSDTGAIFRIALLAVTGLADLSESGIVVDYGPVVIAGKTYTCPVHSVAFSRVSADQGNGIAATSDQTRTFLNDVSFTHYHLFRTEMRILPDFSGK